MTEDRTADGDLPDDGQGGDDGDRPTLSRRTFLGAAALASISATPLHRSLASDALPQAGVARFEGTDGIQVNVRPYGRTAAELALLREDLESTVLASHLSGTRHRWLSFRRDVDGRHTTMPSAPATFAATIYDYERGHTLDLTGRLDDPSSARVTTSSRQPVPTEEEFAEAVDALRSHPILGPPITDGHLLPYRPMPPLLPGGDRRRAVAVGLYAPDPPVTNTADPHRLVGVDLRSREVILEHPVHAAGSADCDAPVAHHDCPDTGRTGQAEITVTQDGEELWRFVVVRPWESSGIMGSGAELRHVTYRERSVLHRAHVPILNVAYRPEEHVAGLFRCGPTYRDWLYEESCFEATGTDVADGVRLCSEEPATIMRSGSDGGNFRGAAIYLDGTDVVVTSELSAGWYRYVTEYKLQEDGNITPRFGFSAVRNPCTCQHHVHHAYWRFDLAVDGLDDHRVEEHNDPPPLGVDDTWEALDREASRDRNAERRRYWRISNRVTEAGYELIPGRDDGRADLYGAGDTWFLRYHPDEIDDRQNFTTNPALSRARLDLYANAEELDGRDVVAWYAGHWHHEHGDDGDWVGPQLRLIGFDD